MPRDERNRKTPAWVPYFLESLERLGQVRAAAEEAGVDFTSAYARRKAHSDFAEAWDAALQRFRAPAAEAGNAQVAAEVAEIKAVVSEALAGTLLDTLGTNDALDGHTNPSPEEEGRSRRRRLARGGNGRWSQAREAVFFEELAASASVRRAAKAAGVPARAVYSRRAKSAHFRTKWDACWRSAGRGSTRFWLQRLHERETAEREEQGWLRDPDHDGHWIPPGWVQVGREV